MTKPLKTAPGYLVAKVLKRCWASDGSQNCALSRAEFDQVTPLLYESGAAGLGWRQVRRIELASTESGELLRQAHRLQSLRAVMHEPQIRKAFRVLRDANLEPILIKGWAVERLYPEPGLRPYGDIDLLIPPRDYRAAAKVIADQAPECRVDFHAPAFELADRSLDDVYARSELFDCGDEKIRVPALEDHFALLAVHLLKHAAWRPLWLCDLGLLLEREQLDWQVCLGRSKQRMNWILSAAGLAQYLLDASISDPYIAKRAQKVPEWLIQTVLKQWERPNASLQPPITYRAPITSYLRRPRGLFRDLVRRWPNPIYATVSVNGTFGTRRRIRYQLGDCLMRVTRTIGRVTHASDRTAA